MRLRPCVRRAALGALLVVSVAACGSRVDDAARGGAAGLHTSFDSARADTIIARVVGEVPSAAIRRTAEELRIAPAADDTSLFGEIHEFDVGPDGRLFVFDASAQTLFLFDTAGHVVRRIGRQGAGPGEFNSNNGMVALPDGRLALWDARNARISYFSADGEFLLSWITASGFSTNHGLRTDRTGTLYLYRPVTPPREGEILGRFGLVRLDAAGAFGDSLVPPDLPVSRITYVASKDGATSSASPDYAADFLWDWHPEGWFVAADGGRYEIHLARPGQALRIVREAPAVPVSQEERDGEQAWITFNMRYTDPSWIWRGPALPVTKAPLAGLRVTRDGRIWARVPMLSERIPDSDLVPPRPGGPPPTRFRNPSAYEVFASDGRFLGRVTLPANAELMEADGDRIWVLDRTADGLPAVLRLRVAPGFEAAR